MGKVESGTEADRTLTLLSAKPALEKLVMTDPLIDMKLLMNEE
jgi:hypothetical protein